MFITKKQDFHSNALSFFALLFLISSTTLASTSEIPQGLAKAHERSVHIITADQKYPGSYTSRNPQQRLDIQFGLDGLRVSPMQTSIEEKDMEATPWHWQLSLDSWGTPMRQQRARLQSTAQDTNRIRFQRGDLTEWYVNSYQGLEQGFTINSAPQKATNVIELRFDLKTNLQLRWKDEGQALAFYTQTGDYAFSYDHLQAWDADGKVLSAEMQTTDQGITLQVATDTARYPITIDPLIATETKIEWIDSLYHGGFGEAVALSDNIAVIGAPRDWSIARESGSAFIYVLENGDWAQEARLIPGDGSPVAEEPGYAREDDFGYSVAISGNTVLVGRPKDDQKGTDSGSAYIFERLFIVGRGWFWAETAKLTASDGAIGDAFGESVAISGNTVLVGAPSANGDVGGNAGAAYIFERSAGIWTQRSKLEAGDAHRYGGFGSSVAISGNSALVGAPGHDDGWRNSGSAYIFSERFLAGVGFVWIQEAKLNALDAFEDDNFGHSVSISADLALIGSPNDDDAGLSSGSAYVFERFYSGFVPTWFQRKKLTASNAISRQFLGHSVSISGNIALVSASGRGSGAYLFKSDKEGWKQQIEFKKPADLEGAGFGRSVSVSANMALMGANISVMPNGYQYKHLAYAYLLQPDEICVPIKARNGNIAMVCL